jgi:hypothetical protein
MTQSSVAAAYFKHGLSSQTNLAVRAYYSSFSTSHSLSRHQYLVYPEFNSLLFAPLTGCISIYDDNRDSALTEENQETISLSLNNI